MSVTNSWSPHIGGSVVGSRSADRLEPHRKGVTILFVQSTDERGATRVFAKTLTAEELRLFEQQGHLLNTAAQVLDFLRTLRSLPEAGNM